MISRLESDRSLLDSAHVTVKGAECGFESVLFIISPISGVIWSKVAGGCSEQQFHAVHRIGANLALLRVLFNQG